MRTTELTRGSGMRHLLAAGMAVFTTCALFSLPLFVLAALPLTHEPIHKCDSQAIPAEVVVDVDSYPGATITVWPIGVECVWPLANGRTYTQRSDDWTANVVAFAGAGFVGLAVGCGFLRSKLQKRNGVAPSSKL